MSTQPNAAAEAIADQFSTAASRTDDPPEMLDMFQCSPLPNDRHRWPHAGNLAPTTDGKFAGPAITS